MSNQSSEINPEKNSTDELDKIVVGSKNFNLEKSTSNLLLLAKELSTNYCTVSLFDLDIKLDEARSISEKHIFSETEEFSSKNFDYSAEFGEPQVYKIEARNKKDSPFHTRNILVLGAGCSFNSFENIPLGKEAINKIKDKIIVARFQEKYGRDNQDFTISFNELLWFYDEFLSVVEGANFNELDITERTTYLTNKLNNVKSKIDREKSSFLIQQFADPYNLLKETASKFKSAVRKWNLINSDYSTDSQNPDFETFLGTIADILPMTSVRSLLSEIYDFKEAPTLFYSVVAHLFKNRFIDVIVNFNFDELLDSAIDLEIGKEGYNKIISDGDCLPIESLTYNGRLRQPLYIKPHGTMSHKSSLRFTKDHYHNIPFDIRQTLIDLFSCSKEEVIKKVNLISVGFNMDSIEFNEIISNYLPPKSNFFLFFDNPPGTEEVSKKIIRKAEKLKLIFKTSEEFPNIYFIANNINNFQESGKPEGKYFDLLSDNSKTYNELDNSFKSLFEFIRGFFKKKYKPSEIYKHLLNTALFGNKKVWSIINSNYQIEDENYAHCPNRYFNKNYYQSADYFRDRIIVEMAISLAVNHARFDAERFMEGNGGKFYRDYVTKFQIEKKKGKIPKNENPTTILQIMSHFPFEEQNNTNSLGIRFLKNYDHNPRKNLEIIITQCLRNLTNKSSLLSKPLKNLLDEDFQNKTGFYRLSIKDLARKITHSNNSKIHSEFNSNKNHKFENFSHDDILNTDLQLDIQCSIDFFDWPASKNPINTICAVNDFGYKIAKLLPEIILKSIQEKLPFKVYLIIEEQNYLTPGYVEIKKNAYLTLMSQNKEFYEGNQKHKDLLKEIVSIYVLPIEDHNRHMIFFMKLKNPAETISTNHFTSCYENVSRAIYYYKKGLSPRIDPIRLEESNNKKYLLEMFLNYSKKSFEFMKRYKHLNDQKEIKNENWIIDLKSS